MSGSCPVVADRPLSATALRAARALWSGASTAGHPLGTFTSPAAPFRHAGPVSYVRNL